MTMVAVSMETASITPNSRFCSGKTIANPVGAVGDGVGEEIGVVG
jgi:hypothetical protein